MNQDGADQGPEDGGPDASEAPAPAPPDLKLDTTAAVILAAGGGTRFMGNGHKLLAIVDKKPVVVWSVQNALKVGFAETIVVMGSEDLSDVLPQDVTLIQNHEWADGQARSLQVAVTYAQFVGYDAIVVGLGDQPLVPPDAWRAVTASDSPVAIADFGGQQTPPVRIHSDVWPLLPIEGDEGARGIVRRRPELVEAISCEGYAVDVDTLADLDRAQSLANTKKAKAQGLDTWT